MTKKKSDRKAKATNNQRKMVLKIKHAFTQDEKNDLTMELTQALQQQNQLADERKHILSDYGSKAKGIAADISELTNRLASGFEFKDRECLVIFDTDRRIRLVHEFDHKRKDGKGAFIREEPMSESDFVMELPGIEGQEAGKSKRKRGGKKDQPLETAPPPGEPGEGSDGAEAGGTDNGE